MSTTLMLRETREVPDVLQRMLEEDSQIRQLAEQVVRCEPRLVMTVGRGSSAHAAEYFNYLLCGEVGIPGMAAEISLLSRNRMTLSAAGETMGIAFSQSGKSPDLIKSIESLSRAGADTVALVNTPQSRLGETAKTCVLLPAGDEFSVAATKSYIAMIMAAAQATALYKLAKFNDHRLLQAISGLPEQASRTWQFDWQVGVDLLSNSDRVILIGRGTTLYAAKEATLKLLETCGIHASAYSSAEARHGPMEIITPGYPVLVFAASGPDQPELLNFALEMRRRGAAVLIVGPEDCAAADLKFSRTAHELLDIFPLMYRFYLFVESLARARGRNPDKPSYLNKVTETE